MAWKLHLTKALYSKETQYWARDELSIIIKRAKLCSALERTLWGLPHMIMSIPHNVSNIILNVQMRKQRLSLWNLLMIIQLKYSRVGTGTQVLTSDPKPLLAFHRPHCPSKYSQCNYTGWVQFRPWWLYLGNCGSAGGIVCNDPLRLREKVLQGSTEPGARIISSGGLYC